MYCETSDIQDSYDEILTVELLDEDETYDLEVDHPTHAFYANDFVVSNSHSTAYAIDSYYAAWLHTHYEKEWLATILQSASSNPKELAKTISEIKSLGYKFSKHDANYSGKQWDFSEEAVAFVPPLGSVKGIGSAAVEEIMVNRPYKDLKTMLYDETGEWRHSKVNKTVLSALCQIEALESLEDFQDCRIRHHKQLLGALTDDKNYETLRKGIYGLTASQIKKLAKEGVDPVPVVDVLLEEQAETEDWSRSEKIAMAYDLTSTADVDLLFPPEIMSKLDDKGVSSIHDVQPGTDGIGWFLVTEVNLKKTKNGKAFYRCKAIDNDSRQGWIRIWGNPTESIEPYTLWVGQASNDPNWGFSTSIFKLRKVA